MKFFWFSVLLLFAPIAAIADPPFFPPATHLSSQRLAAQALFYPDEFSEVSSTIDASDERTNTGQYVSTIVVVSEGSSGPDGSVFRRMECTVPEDVLKVHKAGATLEVQLDADSDSCESYGFICDENFDCQQVANTYSGIVPVSANLSKPLDQLNYNVVETWKYADGGSSSSRCDQYHASADGHFSVGGEITVIINGQNSSGYYELNTCNLN